MKFASYHGWGIAKSILSRVDCNKTTPVKKRDTKTTPYTRAPSTCVLTMTDAWSSSDSEFFSASSSGDEREQEQEEIILARETPKGLLAHTLQRLTNALCRRPLPYNSPPYP